MNSPSRRVTRRYEAAAIGAVAVGRFAIGRLQIDNLRVKQLEVGSFVPPCESRSYLRQSANHGAS